MTTKGNVMAKVRDRNGKIYVDYTMNGKRVQKSTGLAVTPENMEYVKKKVLPELEYRLSIGDLKKREAKTFAYYYEKWEKTKWHLRGFSTNVTQYRKVLAHFGDMRVDEITRHDAKEYLNGLSMKPYSKQSYYSCLSGVLEMALDDEAVNKNVAARIKLGNSERKRVDPFSPEEVAAILSEASGMMRNYLGIAFHTGMRPSEIIGLMRGDIVDGTIHIKRSIVKGAAGETKNKASRRIIPITDAARPFIEAQLKESKGFFLFEEKGHPLWGAERFRRPFYVLLDKLKIRRRALYDTRHTFATAMLNSGRHRVMDIAAMLGHTNAQMIMTTYGGFIRGNHLKIDTDFDPYMLQNSDSNATKSSK